MARISQMLRILSRGVSPVVYLRVLISVVVNRLLVMVVSALASLLAQDHFGSQVLCGLISLVMRSNGIIAHF